MQETRAFISSDDNFGVYHMAATDELLEQVFGPPGPSINSPELGLDDSTLGYAFNEIVAGHKSCGIGACHFHSGSGRDPIQVYVEHEIWSGADPEIVTVRNTNAMRGEMAAISVANGHNVSAGGSSWTVICTELYRQGLMDVSIYMADSAFGKYLKKNDPKVMTGYHFFATPLVKLMQKSKSFTHMVNLIAKPWSYEMAYRMKFRDKGSPIGKAIMVIGDLPPK